VLNGFLSSYLRLFKWHPNKKLTRQTTNFKPTVAYVNLGKVQFHQM